PVPSLFTFHIELPWLIELAGISVPNVELYASIFGLRESGALLITHSGLSGPAVLRLSAWGARPMHGANYKFPIRVNWLPECTSEEISQALEECRRREPARLIVNSPIRPLAARLWSNLVVAAGLAPLTRWAELSRSARHTLIQQLTHSEFQVTGKTLNQD